MARLNIEDDLESREEFRKLVRLVNGDDDKARGMLIRFWRLAQKYWGEHKLVPMEDIELAELESMIQSRWGIKKEDGVYAIGSEERFAWYRQKCDAGKKGGRPKASEITGTEPAQTETKPEETGAEPAETETQSRFDSENPPSPSPVPVLVPIQIQKTKELKAALEKPPPHNLEIPRFIRTYIKAYQKRYTDKTRPDLRGKIQGQIKRFLEEIPIDRACNLIEVYCQMEDDWFHKKRHDFITFAENLNKVSCALDTGQDSNTTDWSQVFTAGGS